METFLIKALQLVLSLSILVILHEFGHYFFSRLFKVRVDKYYVFFHPLFSLARWKKINGKYKFRFFSRNVPSNERPKKDASGNEVKDENGKPQMEQIPLEELPEDDWRRHPESTEWGIGWVPLGGYCKIAGMIDESMDKTALKAPPQKWEFRSQSVWKRFLIIAGGVLVNFLLAFALYAAVLFTWGREVVPPENATYGYNFSQTMLNIGFKNGDKILNINGQKVEEQQDILEKLLLDGNRDVTVMRGGETLELRMPQDLAQQMMQNADVGFASMRFPFVIDSVFPNTNAARAHLMKGDSIIAVNGKQISLYQDVTNEFLQNKNKATVLYFARNGYLCRTTVLVDANGRIGILPKAYNNFLQTVQHKYNLLESIPAGFNYGIETLTFYVKQFKLVFTKAGVKQLGGFGTIGGLFPPVWDWQSFWMLTAFLSIILAFMNFLPIPGLDGGYALFLIYEAITRRKPSDKFMEYATTIGFMLLLLLLVYANGNDLFKWISNLFGL
ncbi:MAG: RIP metalloprotease RseP [Prevotellaceae bacterium]|jgi:regulator of sigma E protease|nr:RIP metalloprotease RseP [Prevotellaceae bacterium]